MDSDTEHTGTDEETIEEVNTDEENEDKCDESLVVVVEETPWLDDFVESSKTVEFKGFEPTNYIDCWREDNVALNKVIDDYVLARGLYVINKQDIDILNIDDYPELVDVAQISYYERCVLLQTFDDIRARIRAIVKLCIGLIARGYDALYEIMIDENWDKMISLLWSIDGELINRLAEYGVFDK